MLKEVRYTAFDVIEEDTNPGLYMPLGFAGGLHDRDINWIRFGYRDYDPLTARFTAKDPMGYAAGDSDLRGYCFDDPVNKIDPEGLNPYLFRGLVAAEQAWKYVSPFVETGLPASGFADVGVEAAKRYGKDALDATKDAGKWYIDTVDKNLNKQKEMRKRFDNENK